MDINRSEDLATMKEDIDRLEDLVTGRKRISTGSKTWRRGKRILTSQKASDFLAAQLEDFQNQKQQIESRIAELETQQAGNIKQWKKEKNNLPKLPKNNFY